MFYLLQTEIVGGYFNGETPALIRVDEVTGIRIRQKQHDDKPTYMLCIYTKAEDFFAFYYTLENAQRTAKDILVRQGYNDDVAHALVSRMVILTKEPDPEEVAAENEKLSKAELLKVATKALEQVLADK